MKIDREKKKVICKHIPTKYSITCGPENPSSLGCVFYQLEDGEMATFFVAKQIHEGQLDIVHGGLSASVLDELMGRAALVCGEAESDEDFVCRYVTAQMTVQYKKPIYVGHKIYGYGRVYNKEGRRRFTSSELVNEEGEIVATAEGVFVEIKVPKSDLSKYGARDKNGQKLSKNDPKEL